MSAQTIKTLTNFKYFPMTVFDKLADSIRIGAYF